MASDSTASISIAFILFFYPSTPPAILVRRHRSEKHQSASDINKGMTSFFLPASHFPLLHASPNSMYFRLIDIRAPLQSICTSFTAESHKVSEKSHENFNFSKRLLRSLYFYSAFLRFHLGVICSTEFF